MLLKFLHKHTDCKILKNNEKKRSFGCVKERRLRWAKMKAGGPFRKQLPLSSILFPCPGSPEMGVDSLDFSAPLSRSPGLPGLSTGKACVGDPS